MVSAAGEIRDYNRIYSFATLETPQTVRVSLESTGRRDRLELETAKARMPHFSPGMKPTLLGIALAMTLAAPLYAVEGGSARGNDAQSLREPFGAHTDFPRQPKLAMPDTSPPSPAAEAVGDRTLPLASKRLPAPVDGESSPKPSGWSTLLNALASLAVVLGLFLAVVWFLRRTGPKSLRTLPGEVFEVLGHWPLAARHQAQLVRCGNKLLLLSVTTGGAETLAEITDAAEVERLVGLCQQARPNSATASFRNLFSQFGGDEAGSSRTSMRSGRFGLPRLSRPSTEVADV